MRSVKFTLLGMAIATGAMVALAAMTSGTSGLEFAINGVAGVIGGGTLGFIAHRLTLGYDGAQKRQYTPGSFEALEVARLSKARVRFVVAIVIDLVLAFSEMARFGFNLLFLAVHATVAVLGILALLSLSSKIDQIGGVAPGSGERNCPFCQRVVAITSKKCPRCMNVIDCA